MARIVVSEFMDAAAVARLAAVHDVLHDPTLVDDAPRLQREAAGAEALIVRNRTEVRGPLLASMERCRVVGRLGVGLDNIDVDACAARGIAVLPATGANALAVAEYVITAALMLLRGAYASSDEVAAGGWPRAKLGTGREAAGKTLGLVGFGSIGQCTARLGAALGLRPIAFDPAVLLLDPAWQDVGATPVALDELVASADIISLHVPLVAATRGLIDARRIAAMRPGTILVNTARGGIVDEAAVAAALRSGHLGGAAIDVFPVEPPPADNPLVGCPRLLLTPHIAGVSVESNERVSALVADKVLRALG